MKKNELNNELVELRQLINSMDVPKKNKEPQKGAPQSIKMKRFLEQSSVIDKKISKNVEVLKKREGEIVQQLQELWPKILEREKETNQLQLEEKNFEEKIGANQQQSPPAQPTIPDQERKENRKSGDAKDTKKVTTEPEKDEKKRK